MKNPADQIMTLEAELEETYRSVTELTNELEEIREKLEHLSLYDELTGLPNRNLFRDRFETFKQLANRQDKPFAVFLMDLNRFKTINDTFGHEAGDEVLRVIAERLKQRLRGTDTVARVGGDEFAFLLQLRDAEKDGAEIAGEIVNIVRQPIDIDNTPVDVGASIGITFFPTHSGDLSELLRHADRSMYEAKKRGGSFVFHDGTTAVQGDVKLPIFLGEIQKAVENGEMAFHMQPKIEMQTMKWCGSEALMRWQCPKRGLIMPDDFIPLAERSPLIVPLTRVSLTMALERLASADLSDHANSISINLSPRSLHDPGLADEVMAQLRDTRQLAELLVFEITESALMIEPEKAVQTLTQFASLGVRISIDDFGTGYSSLSYLSQLPVTEVKIDRSFVRKMHAHKEDLAIIQSLVDLANKLDMTVVAEGVETKEDWITLADLGCHLAQGYYISRPVPTDELDIWSARWHTKMDGESLTA